MSNQADLKNNQQPSKTLITLEALAAAAQRLRSQAKKRRHNITVGNVTPEGNSKGTYPSDSNNAVSGGN
jgi:hypothetical protein